MNITQIESFNLDDAVKFHDNLNPILWDRSEHLHPEIRQKLLVIAEDFLEFLGVGDLDFRDVTLSGSNAAFSYTPNSDIDLHLIVDMSRASHPDVYKELFNAKKSLYNDQHKITIKNIPVELYVQDANEKHISQGIYSVLNDKWIEIPRRRKAEINDISVKSKYSDMRKRINHALKSKSIDVISEVIHKIQEMRKAGLAQEGEFGPENLAFKMLRNKGDIKKLFNARKKMKDQELSLKERTRPPVNYGYGRDHLDEVGLTPDGVSASTREFASESQLDEVGLTPDGVSASTREFASEDAKLSDEDILRDFIKFCFAELKLNDMPAIKLRKDPQWSVVNRTFGRYTDDKKMLEVAWGSRHIMDVLRTVAHELTHKHQHERDGKEMTSDAGETGSRWENEANARAGILMRDYARLHPDYFAIGQAQGLHEASGYIPTEAEKNDPRYLMAITQDVKPGEIGRCANAFLLNTDAQGHPQELRPDGMVKRMMHEYLEFKQLPESIGPRLNKNDELSGNSFVSQGCTIKFTPTSMTIYKGGDLLIKKDGNYSKPTKQQLASAKAYITRMVPKLQKGLVPNTILLNKLDNLKQEIEQVDQEYDLYMKPYFDQRNKVDDIRDLQRQYFDTPEYNNIKTKGEKLRAKYNKLAKSGDEWIRK